MTNDPIPGLRPPIHTVSELEDLLSEPSDGAIELLSRLPGDFLLLGAGGKIGPSLARMIRRASDVAGTPRRVIAVSRYSDPQVAATLEAHDLETIRCDLLDPVQFEKLPEVPNIVYLAGRKFGGAGHEAELWAMNTHLPTLVSRKFCHGRILVFSTGNVYGLTPVARGGSLESDPLNPVGEYAMSCVGRERLFEYFSRRLNIPMAFIRLNYAAEMRYGVLVDLGRRVLHGEPVAVTTAHFNTLWEADACAMSLQAFQHASSPPFVVNVTGPERLSVRDVAEKFAEYMGREVTFRGREATTSLLSSAQLCQNLFGPPRVHADQLIYWVAHWLMDGGVTWSKPTQFDSRNGQF